MITKLTAENFDEFYAPRFAEITDKLHEAGLLNASESVTNIETYFANLTKIGMLPTQKGQPGKYLVVPFDEPYFEINANTRTIAVPDHFKKYGVGVYGDNIAEMLVFKIDRYFDHQDLYNTDIAINWSFTPKGSRNPIMGTPQAAFAPDCDLEPGYVVFGFYITRDMAQDVNGNLASGTLNFAISFYNNDANAEIAYSFNTIPATVTINEGLELKDPSAIKDISLGLIARLTDSAYTPDGIIPLDEPQWLTGDSVMNPVNNELMYLGLPSELNFHMDDYGVEDDDLLLTAQAYSDSMTTMRYSWFTGYDDDSIVTARPIDSYTDSTDFMVTVDEEPVEGKTYYVNVQEIAGAAAREAAFEDLNKVILEVKNGAAKITSDSEPKEAHNYYEHADGLNNMVKVTDIDTLNALFNDAFNEYELGTSFVVKQAGKYIVRAQAEKEVHQSTGTIPVVEEDDGSVLKVKANKVAAASVSDPTAKLNQGKFEILQENNSIVLVGKLTELGSFASSNPNQGTHAWLAVDLQTNTNDIATLTWDGEPLGASDVEEAASVGLGAGHIIFWAKADVLANSPRTIRISKVGGDAIEIVVSFADSSVKSVLQTLIDKNNAENIQQDNVVVVKSGTITSNVCNVPAAAKPWVNLTVETSITDDYSIIDEDQAANYTYIGNDAPPRIIAVVESTNEQPLGAIAFEALESDNVTDLTAEEIIANTKSEENPTGKYEFELLEDGQKEINADGVITEGTYVVRAINRRNHSYNVSEPSQVINTSFIAPAITDVTVTTVDGGTEVVMLDKGLAPVDPQTGERRNTFIRLNSNYPSRRFTIVDESTNNLPGAQPTYFMEEVIRTANNGYVKKDPRDESDNLVEYKLEVVENGDAYECVVDDEGIYRIRIENVYNGTRRIGYTDVFEVLRLA